MDLGGITMTKTTNAVIEKDIYMSPKQVLAMLIISTTSKVHVKCEGLYL